MACAGLSSSCGLSCLWDFRDPSSLSDDEGDAEAGGLLIVGVLRFLGREEVGALDFEFVRVLRIWTADGVGRGLVCLEVKGVTG